MPDTSVKNPWRNIWINPKETIRQIVSTNPKFRLYWLYFIYGLPMAFSFSQSYSLINAIPLWTILIAALIVAPFIGAAGVTIASWLIQWTGRWIGGKANFQNIRAAFAWAQVPNILSILMWIVLLICFGGNVFSKAFSEMQFVGSAAGVVFVVFLVQTIAMIWGLVILCHTLGEVQGFSAWKGLLNVVIPFVILVAVIWFVGWILYGRGSIQ